MSMCDICYFYWGRKETLKCASLTWDGFCSFPLPASVHLFITATNEMSLSICDHHQNTVKAKSIQTSSKRQQIWSSWVFLLQTHGHSWNDEFSEVEASVLLYKCSCLIQYLSVVMTKLKSSLSENSSNASQCTVWS